MEVDEKPPSDKSSDVPLSILNLPNQNSSRKRKCQYCEFCDYSKRKRTKQNCALCKKPTCESHIQIICPKCFDT